MFEQELIARASTSGETAGVDPIGNVEKRRFELSYDLNLRGGKKRRKGREKIPSRGIFLLREGVYL